MEAPRMARPMIVLMARPMVNNDTWIVGSSAHRPIKVPMARPMVNNDAWIVGSSDGFSVDENLNG